MRSHLPTEGVSQQGPSDRSRLLCITGTLPAALREIPLSPPRGAVGSREEGAQLAKLSPGRLNPSTSRGGAMWLSGRQERRVPGEGPVRHMHTLRDQLLINHC